MKLIKRILAVMLVACLALSLAGCGDTTWICEVDGETVPAGLYIYYQTQGYGEALYNLVMEDSSNYYMYYLYYMNFGYVDPDLFEVTLDNKTVKEYINDYAMDMCKQAVVIDKLFDELGLELSADDNAIIDNSVKNVWANSGDTLESLGISEDSYKKAVVASYKEEKVFDAYYEIGGLNGTTEAEIENYFSDNYARIKYITFQFSDSVDDAVDEARKTEQLNLANEYLDMAKSGTSMDDIIEQYTNYLNIINGVEPDEDEDVAVEDEETDEYANESILSVDGTYPTEKFVNYVFTNCPVGEYTVIQDDTCFYLVERLDILEREGLYDNYRDSILYELFDSDYTGLINQRLNGYTVSVNDSAVKRYKVEKAFPDVF